MTDNPITLRSFELKGPHIIIEFTHALNDHPQPIKIAFDRNEHNIGDDLDRAILRKMQDLRIHTLSILDIIPALPAHQHFNQHGGYQMDLVSDRFSDIKAAWVKGNQSKHKGFPKPIANYDVHFQNFRIKKFIVDESQSHVVLQGIKIVGGQKVTITSPAMNIMSELDTEKAVSYLFYPMLRTDIEVIEALCAELINKTASSLKRQLNLFDNELADEALASFENFSTEPFAEQGEDNIVILDSKKKELPEAKKELPAPAEVE